MNIHWFSILNSVIIIIFLFAIISIIIVKTIRRDINQVILFHYRPCFSPPCFWLDRPLLAGPDGLEDVVDTRRSGGLKLVF